MTDEPMTLDDVREWLGTNVEAGVTQVRISTVLANLPEPEPDHLTPLVARVKQLEDELADARAEVYSERERHEQYLADAAPASAPDGLSRAQRLALTSSELVKRAGANPKTYDTKEGARVTAAGVLVGTAEAAAILGVERPRIGRYRAIAGKMPTPVAELAAGPVWLRSDIEAMVGEMETRRKPRKAAEAQVSS